MCGICGLLDLRETPHREPGTFRRMRDVLAHRGPDDQGEFADGPAYLGFRRLSIVDLAGGHQPMSNEDGRLWLVYNGEIYNHLELRRELEARGHRYRTRSDSETLLHGFEEWGPEVVLRLRGMFAFAIYDTRARSVFAARDRLGIKPFYFYHHGPLLVFASEIKSLLVHPDVPREADRVAISDYLTYRYVPGPDTLFRGIRKLLPGHRLTFQDGRLEEEPYWDVSYRERFRGTYEEAYERVKGLVTESVRLRLMSDVPLGALLSGGVDSSVIVGVMAGLMDRPVDTYSVGFRARGSHSELRYARQVAERFATHHHELEVGEEDVLEALPRLVWYQDEPVTEPAALPTYLISRLAKHEVTVALTGEGGDELFAGYAKYAHDRFAGLYAAIPVPLRKALLDRLGARGRRLHVADRSLSIRDDAERWSSWFAGFDAEEKQALLAPDFARETACSPSSRIFAGYLERVAGEPPLHQMLYTDTKVWLPDDLLMKMDRMSMGASLEARVPLLDHLLVEFAATLPPGFKLRGLRGKRMLKQWAREMLPREVVERRKVGFTVPVGEWFRGGLREALRDALLSPRARARGYFNPARVEILIQEHLSGARDHARALWTLMQLEAWHRMFVDAASVTEAAPDGQLLSA
ncbi:MAG TPA: asparagine synthase (glutamine-hydrolyzing) [Candidatus Saccharimonadales bacterium]|nr:asparagine synthase (glutamine-hydrolyzing) [Candidatus Saccharimonadales bacterium]